MSFNLKRIADAPSATVEIKDPETGAPLGVSFILAGPEHPKRKQIEFDRQRRLRAVMNKTGKIELGDPEDDDQEARQTLATCILGWNGYEDDNGPVAYTADAAKALANDPDLGWLRVQLNAALAERERFIKRSVLA